MYMYVYICIYNFLYDFLLEHFQSIDRDQIGVKLGAKPKVTYQKLANFMCKKGIYVNSLKNVIFYM